MSSSYHPGPNRQIESLNKCVEIYLRVLCQTAKRTGKALSWSELCYIMVYQYAVGTTPFEIDYRHLPPHLVLLVTKV